MAIVSGTPIISSRSLKALLRERHHEDIYGEEVSLGGTQFDSAGQRRLDAWAATCSWKNPRYIGYEIKVTRADFMADHKMVEYRSGCTELYLVTAPGVIKDVQEIPDGVGWIEATANGRRLLTKRRATHTAPCYPVIFNILKSMAMRGVTGQRALDPEYVPDVVDRTEYTHDKAFNKLRGYRLAQWLALERVSVKRRAKRLEEDEATWKEVRDFATRMKLDVRSWRPPTAKDIEARFAAVNSQVVPGNLKFQITELKKVLAVFETTLQTYEQQQAGSRTDPNSDAGGGQ